MPLHSFSYRQNYTASFNKYAACPNIICRLFIAANINLPSELKPLSRETEREREREGWGDREWIKTIEKKESEGKGERVKTTREKRENSEFKLEWRLKLVFRVGGNIFFGGIIYSDGKKWVTWFSLHNYFDSNGIVFWRHSGRYIPEHSRCNFESIE